jgi:hypothetical protein
LKSRAKIISKVLSEAKKKVVLMQLGDGPSHDKVVSLQKIYFG